VLAAELPAGGVSKIYAVATVQASNATAGPAQLTCRLKRSGTNIGLAYTQTIAPGTTATLTVSGSGAATPSQSVMVACSETDNDVTLTAVQGELHVWIGS
jgi:hypothetical protein